MPPAATILEPAEMAAEGSGDEDGTGILTEFFVRKRFVDRDLRCVSTAISSRMVSHVPDRRWH